jgi:aryl-alcohol dehydrogenase-like predicted oxidoreductase
MRPARCGPTARTVSAVSSDDLRTPPVPLTRLAPDGPVVSRIGLGLAALGRPAYITSGRAGDLPDRSVDGLAARTFTMLDAAYAAGIRYFDAARSYGRAEEFLGAWLADRGAPDAVAGSKWGYRYTGDWRLDAEHQEIKEHSLAMFTAQLAETRAFLGDRLALYQIHSLTTDSGPLDDPELLAGLAGLRAQGVIVGITTSGPGQADTLRRALEATVDGQPVFSSAQVTWNLLEPSVGPAAAEAAGAGWAILIKEALANGRLAPGGDPAGTPAQLTALADAQGVAVDAVAIAAALANRWASVVLSGAVTPGQLESNLGALAVTEMPRPDLAEPPAGYWSARSGRPWQ